ncbi:hypothetical protein TELCIR_07496 [Teladorsagia circumcincta]|uniref:Phosphorylase b kinase regulatory subunit n=1 Tax=Teladorsagia circumcincta TaxID=45464 RepID=A0A2G9UK63_TELCI|nr:hypothetical protein TELCIR_07496 [Teladorsagia circumcincta]
MQSLLECMMRQADKVEMFKKYQRPVDSLHSKFSVSTKSTDSHPDRAASWSPSLLDGLQLLWSQANTQHRKSRLAGSIDLGFETFGHGLVIGVNTC